MLSNTVMETINENGEGVRAIDKQEVARTVMMAMRSAISLRDPDKKFQCRINKTLYPCREESVDFYITENLYIDGDNLEVLKLLQETHLGKIN